MEQHDCDEYQTLFEIHAERSRNCHRFCKTLSQHKHIVFPSTAPLQLKRFEVGCWVAVVASSPLQPIQQKTPLPNRPIQHLKTILFLYIPSGHTETLPQTTQTIVFPFPQIVKQNSLISNLHT
jgi:hypothetical protein